jgi:hypothetical protein
MQDQQIHQQVIIVIQSGNVYLHNKLSEPIDSLIYETFSMVTSDDIVGISSSPTYKIQNIPSNQVVLLEVLDRWEDGQIYYNLLALNSSTIHFEGKLSFKTKRLSGMFTLPQTAVIEKIKLSSTSGFIVDMNPKTINNLYWIVEDLMAYTDLTGDHFDIEKAQFKLWKMKPFLSEFENSDITNIYEQLNTSLENSAFFDKNAFTTITTNLFNNLEELRKKSKD